MMEKKLSVIQPGGLVLIIQLLIAVFVSYWTITNWETVVSFSVLGLDIFLTLIFFVIFGGYIVVNINENVVYQFMGKYKGTLSVQGFYWTNPFYGLESFSTAAENIETQVLEVNEKTGTPIQIAALINYKLTNTYKVKYEVASFQTYIENKFLSTLREFAKKHTYQQLSELDHNFVDELNVAVEPAGIEVSEVKLTRLNYVESIAGAMLQNQQAQSMSDARTTIVNNALHIANRTATEISFTNQNDRAKFIANLILVLCSHTPTTPTINVGSN